MSDVLEFRDPDNVQLEFIYVRPEAAELFAALAAPDACSHTRAAWPTGRCQVMAGWVSSAVMRIRL